MYRYRTEAHPPDGSAPTCLEGFRRILESSTLYLNSNLIKTFSNQKPKNRLRKYIKNGSILFIDFEFQQKLQSKNRIKKLNNTNFN